MAVEFRKVDIRRGFFSSLCSEYGFGVVELQTDDVAIIMPDVETTILALGKEQIAPVGTDARKGRTLVVRGCIIDEFLFTEVVRCHVERTAIEVVLYFGIGGSDILVAQLFRKWNRLAVIEILAIGRPSGIHL